VTLPVFAAECRRPQLSIDISGPQGAQQQTRRPPLLLWIDGTDGRTPGRSIDLSLHAVRRLGIVNNNACIGIDFVENFVANRRNRFVIRW